MCLLQNIRIPNNRFCPDKLSSRKKSHAIELDKLKLVQFFPFFFFLVQDVQEEGRHAIDSPGAPNAPEIPPEDYILRKLPSRKVL